MRTLYRYFRQNISPPVLTRFLDSMVANQPIFSGVRSPEKLLLNAIHEVNHSNEWASFRDSIAEVDVYGEWGSGASTLFVAERNKRVKILSAESDAQWVTTINNQLGERHAVSLVNIGEVGEYGRPTSFSHRANYIDYVEFPFKQGPGLLPQVLLIDGRFRVACFLTALMHSPPGTNVFFDDYSYRPHYHVVEEFLRPEKISGRQAQFVTQPMSSQDELKVLRDKFLLVSD